MELGWKWMFKGPCSTRQPVVLGEQLCAQGTWLCCTGDLGTWGGTSGSESQRMENPVG